MGGKWTNILYTGARCVRKKKKTKYYIILQGGELTCFHFFESYYINKTLYVKSDQCYNTNRREHDTNLVLISKPEYNYGLTSMLLYKIHGKTGVPEKNHRPDASHWQTLSNNVVSSTPRHKQN
jgi:hypothetical protein